MSSFLALSSLAQLVQDLHSLPVHAMNINSPHPSPMPREAVVDGSDCAPTGGGV